MKIKENMIYDLVHYLDINSGASDEKCEGIVVGVIGVLTAMYDFKYAVKFFCNIYNSKLKPYSRISFNPRELNTIIPESWKPEFEKWRVR